MPKYTKPRKTWRYSNEFKVKAVQLSLVDDVQVKEIADTLDIQPFLLSRWRKEYREGKIVADKRKKLTDVSPKQKSVWVANVTYIKVKSQWHYLSAVMDLHSRRIVGCSLDTERTTEVTKRTLATAIKKRKPEKGLMLHTDRGVEYRGAEYQKALKRHGILHSLRRPGQCTDNAHMESFFHTLKAELIRGANFQSAEDLRCALGRYINDFYNRTRLHSGIGYCSPVEYERLAV